MAFLYGIVGWQGPRYSFLRLLRTSVAPEDFGAAGDGVTDDSSAVQLAVDTGKHVYCKNNYLIKSTVSMDGNIHQTIFGGGTFKLADNRDFNTHIFGLNSCWNVEFQGIKFNGNKANQVQPATDNSWDAAAKRVYFTPVMIDGCNKIKVKDCEFYDVCTVSLNFGDSQNIKIINSHFHDSYMDALFTAYSSDNENIEIHGNTIERITYRDSSGEILYRYGNGIVVNADKLRITNNTISNCDRSGMKPMTQPSMNDIYIARNKITNCDWQGINPQGGYNITIEENEIDGSGWNGILVGYDSLVNPIHDIIISNNIITNSGTRDTGEEKSSQEGIFLSGDTYNAYISENIIDTTGGSGILSTFSHDITTYKNIIKNTTYRPIYINGDGLPDSSKRTYNFYMNEDELYCNLSLDDGIKVADYSYNLTFSKVKIFDASSTGINLYYTDNVLVYDCSIDSSIVAGIRVGSAKNTIIRDCLITDSGSDGILIVKQSEVEPDTILIDNNEIDGTGRYGILIYNSPVDLTIEESNIFTNITASDVHWA